MKQNHAGFRTNQGTNEQSQQQEIIIIMKKWTCRNFIRMTRHVKVKMELSKTLRSNNTIYCCYWMLWGTMATIVVLVAILTSISLTVASTDFQASKDFQGKSALYSYSKKMAIIFECMQLHALSYLNSRMDQPLPLLG